MTEKISRQRSTPCRLLYAVRGDAVLVFVCIFMLPANAQSQLVLGDNKSARECFERAEFSVTSTIANKQDIEVCNRALESMVMDTRDRAATLVNRGILQLAMGDVQAARASYDKALTLAADQGEIHINIGNIHMRQKDYALAVAAYSHGIPTTSRRLHVAYLNRGLAYEYLRDYAKCVADYQRALELAPEWIRAQKMLARAQAKMATLDESGGDQALD